MLKPFEAAAASVSTFGSKPRKGPSGGYASPPRLRGQGEQVRVFGTKQEISEEKEAQEKIQSLQTELIYLSRVGAMSTWAATLAHELNQPLSAIVNYMGAARLLSRKEVISSKLWIVSRVRERQPSARAK